MSTNGMDLSPARVRNRQRQITRELNVTMRTVTRYRRQAKAGERRG